MLTVIHACYQWYLYSSKRKTSQQPDRTMLHLLYVASASWVCYKYAKSRTTACSIGIRYLATSLHTRIQCSVVCHASDFHSKLVFQQDSSTTLQSSIFCCSVDVFFLINNCISLKMLVSLCSQKHLPDMFVSTFMHSFQEKKH